MTKNNIILSIVSVLILAGLIGLGTYSMKHANELIQAPADTRTSVPDQGPVNTVTFYCDGNKAIGAAFYPENDDHVSLMLSDGRSMNLPHAMSGSGARYATADESVVFWNKGTTAFITENGKTTYANCDTNKNTASATVKPAPVNTPAVDVGEKGTVCTMEAKQCPDGSYVGRTGPHCEFAACPGN